MTAGCQDRTNGDLAATGAHTPLALTALPAAAHLG